MTDAVSTPSECDRSMVIAPPFAPLFRSNTCPFAVACIQPFVKAHERQLATLQDDADHLKRRLPDLERRRVHTHDFVLAQLYKALAPIRRLPPEILSEIFEHCLDKQHARVRFVTTARSKVAPLLLGRVCRAWRAVAHATPRLWQDVLINVCDGRYSDELRRDAMPVLQTWLACSGSLPLNLFLLCKAERILPGLVDLFETIASHGARWRTVHVRLQNSPVIYRLVCRAFSKCPSLSTLDLTDGGHSLSFFGVRQPDEIEDVQPVRFDLSLAPLRHLSLSLAGLTIRDVHAPWAMLTSLSFMQDAYSSTSSITDYVAVLRQCTSLKECSITIDSGIRDGPLESFTLPSLESLQLHVLQPAAQTAQLGDLLNVLDAPRLNALAIEDACPRREAISYHDQLKAFLRAHAKSVRRLKFVTSSRFFTSEDLIAWIVETPSLTELEYHPDEESSPKGLLEALTPRVQGDVVECLLPRLERFLVYWDTTETVSTVGDMIEKRYALVERGIGRLRYLSCKPLRISIGYDCVPEHLLVENLAERLEPLGRSGLRVDWEAYRYDVEFLYC